MLDETSDDETTTVDDMFEDEDQSSELEQADPMKVNVIYLLHKTWAYYATNLW